MIESLKDYNSWNQEEYPAAKLNTKGEDWILANQNQLQFRKTDPEFPKHEDLPF